MDLKFTFSAGFTAGSRNVCGSALDNANRNSGWISLTSWNLP